MANVHHHLAVLVPKTFHTHTKDSELLERNGKRAQYFTSHRLRLHPVAALLTCLLKRHAVQSTISRGYQVEMPIDAALTS